MRIPAISALLLLVYAGHAMQAMASTDIAPQASDARLQDALASEFLFQAGDFHAAFDYYRGKAPAQLNAQELQRGRQIARVLGEAEWLRQTDALARSVETGIDARTRRFEESVRKGDARQAALDWQALSLAGPEEAGLLAARESVAVLLADYRAVLEDALAAYAKLPGLGPGERLALLDWAWQWRMQALAAALASDAGGEAQQMPLAAAISACHMAESAACTAALQVLEPAQLDEAQRRLALSLAEAGADAAQVGRWLTALPQDGASYYRRLLLVSKLADPGAMRALRGQIAADAALTAFQRAALLGSLAEIGKDWPSAEAHYREVLATGQPGTAALRLPVVLMQQRLREPAFAQLRSVQDDPGYSDEIRREAFRMEIQFNRALQADAAVQDAVFRRALAYWPDAHALRYQYAMQLFEWQQSGPALAQLQTLIRRAPADADALNAYGYTLAKEMDRPRQALTPIRKAYLLAPRQPEILDSYGYVLYRLGRSREALPLLQQAMQMAPSAVTAGHLAAVHFALGDAAQAKQALDKGLQLDRNDAELLSLQERLR